jgi:hypothetical protein
MNTFFLSLLQPVPGRRKEIEFQVISHLMYFERRRLTLIFNITNPNNEVTFCFKELNISRLCTRLPIEKIRWRLGNNTWFYSKEELNFYLKKDQVGKNWVLRINDQVYFSLLDLFQKQK